MRGTTVKVVNGLKQVLQDKRSDTFFSECWKEAWKEAT